jgi:hypothetical protein
MLPRIRITYSQPILLQHRVQLLVRKAAVGQQRDFECARDQLEKTRDHFVLDLRLPLAELVGAHRLPEQRRRAAVRGHEVQHQRRLAVGIEGRPVERKQRLAPRAEHEGDPLRKERPRLDGFVAQQPIDLLDGVLGVEVELPRQRHSDRMHAQRCRSQLPNGRVGQRQHPLGVQVPLEQLAKLLAHHLDRRVAHLPRHTPQHDEGVRHSPAADLPNEGIAQGGSPLVQRWPAGPAEPQKKWKPIDSLPPMNPASI